MAALQYADVPGYSALLLRKTYPELSQPGGLMDRAHDWLQGKAKWNEQKHTWRFPSGAQLAFGYLQRQTDRFRYQGAEFDFVGFDELTHFAEEDYTYLFSRLRRRSGSRVPPRMRAATNPGGRGHRWVKARFIDAPKRGRLFIPASLYDNPGVDRESYLLALEEVDPQTRAQLLEGDWNAREPGNWVFDHHGLSAAERLGAELDALLAADRLPPPAQMVLGTGQSVENALALGIDYGDFRTHGLVLYPLERGGMYVCAPEVATSRADPEQITRELLKAAGSVPGGWWLAEARYDAAFPQTNRTFVATSQRLMGPHNPMRKDGRPNTRPIPFAKHKSEAVGYLRLLLRRTLAGESTRILAISPRNRILLEQMGGYELREDGGFVKGDDDAVDALISGIAPVARRHRDATDRKDAASPTR